MVRSIVGIGLLAATSLLGQTQLIAQGKGNGLNRALGAAAKGAAGSGLSRSRGPLSAASNNAIRSGSSLGRGNGSLQRASAATTRAPRMPTEIAGDHQAIGNQQPILDKRLDQADHLRSVSERNGNERLLETAGRMETNAARNYERQQQQLSSAASQPVRGSREGPAETSAIATEGTAPAARAAQVQPRARRGFWFRSR